MKFTTKQRKSLLIGLFASASLFILELIGTKYGYISLSEINQFELSLLFIFPVTITIILLLLIYDSWFRSKKEGLLLNLKKGFFWILSGCMIVGWFSLYIIFFLNYK